MDRSKLKSSKWEAVRGEHKVTLAEIVFTKKKLAEKYGVEGRVAGLYVEAGYSVEMHHPVKGDRVSFVARKEGVVVAVDVVNGSVRVTGEVVSKIAEKAKVLGAKPVIVLYGSGPRLTEEAQNLAKELGVAVKRVRF